MLLRQVFNNKSIVKATTSVLLASVAAMAGADTHAPLKGETINFVVGYGPGGGFDTYARVLGPALAEELEATVVVQNMPGGGSRTATNTLFREDPDGTTIYILNGVPSALGQITEAPGVTYDLSEFTWIGRVNAEPWVLMVNNDSPFYSTQDLIDADRQIVFSAMSRADGPSDGAAILCETLQLDCAIRLGFSGSSEARLAVYRGDADGIILTDTSINDSVQGDQARAITVLGNSSSQFFPDLDPVSEELNLDGEAEFWNDYRGNVAEIGRSIIAPPGMSEELTAYLRDALETVLTDEAFLQELADRGLDIKYLSGAELETIVDSVFEASKSGRGSEIKNVLLNKYF